MKTSDSNSAPESYRQSSSIVQLGIAVAVAGLVGLPAVSSPHVAREIGEAVRRGNPTALQTLVGLVIGAALTFVLVRAAMACGKRDGFVGEVLASIAMLQTLEHERAHILIGLLVGLHPRSVNASEVKYGEVRWATPRGPLKRARFFLGVIAPYWFSPAALTVALLALAFPPGQPLWAATIGLLAGAALILPVAQFHSRQRELRQFFFVPTAVAVLWLWAACATVTLSIVFSARVSQVAGMYAAGWRQLAQIVGM